MPDAKVADAKIADVKTADAKPADVTPPDTTPADATVADGKPTASAAPDTRKATILAGASRLIEGVRRERKPSGAGSSIAAKVATAAEAIRPVRVPLAAGAAVALTLAVGYGLGTATDPAVGAAAWSETTSEVRAARHEMAQFAGELRGLRSAVDAIKSDRERSRGDILGKQAHLADQLDRIEKRQRDPARLQGVTERLERIEKGMASLTTPVPPPKPVAAVNPAVPDVTQTGSIAEAKPAGKAEPDPRKTQVEGFFVRDIDSGYALVETKTGRYVEVAVGQSVPGLGRVEAIERRGRQWVVVTPKGFIAER